MDNYIIVTPSNIEVEYRLANAGSRLAAFIIDFTLQMAAILAIALLVLFGFAGFRFSTLNEVGGTALAVVMIAAFIIYFGYFILSEMLMNGQTVGKKIFGLRVIRDNGLPIALSQSLVRNLLRPALDIWYVGLFLILFSKHHKRLGDMAAGTIVVSEHAGSISEQLRFYKTANGESATSIYQTDLSDILPDRAITQAEQYLVDQWALRRFDFPDNGEAIRNMLLRYFKTNNESV